MIIIGFIKHGIVKQEIKCPLECSIGLDYQPLFGSIHTLPSSREAH